MKKFTCFLLAVAFLTAEITAQTHTVLAATADVPVFPQVIISEMQPGTTVSASQEFIELYNQSASTIDLTKDVWQVQIASSTATDWSKAKTVSLSGLFYPGRYMLIASNYAATGDTKSYLQDYATAQFTSGLTASSGHIRIVTKASLATTIPAEDSLEWSTKNGSGQLVSNPIAGSTSVILDSDIPVGSSLKRAIVDGYFVTSNTGSATEFVLSPCPSPTATNTSQADVVSDPNTAVPTTIDATNQTCAAAGSDSNPGIILPPTSEPPAELLPSGATTPGASSIPPVDVGLEAPQITEILPNPAPPQTDANDEFIELYNGNSVDFDLSGFSLLAGAAGSQHYVLPAGTILAAKAFRAFYARDTGLSLSNSGGQVALLDPLGTRLGQTDSYGAAKEGQSWALAAHQWGWTDLPTPGSANIVHLPAPKAQKFVSAVKTKTNAKSQTAALTPKASPAKKSAAAKTKAKTKKPKAKKSAVSGSTSAPASQERTPIHPGVLALVCGFALIYGLYEYRGDLANKIYQFRNDRAARRALGEGDPGW